MRDTIYREEAIKKIAEHLGVPAENWMGIAEEWIKDVQSAQPEYTEQDVRDAFNDGYRCGMDSAQPEQAQWVQMLINRNMYKCSNCKNAWNKRLVFDNDGNSENIFMKYCPCCGRKMQTEVDYE